MDVAVLGAGTRGLDLARICAVAGHEVRLYDGDANAVMDGIDRVGADLASVGSADAADRIDGTTGLDSAVSGADVVLDAADGDRSDRRERFAEVESLTDEETLLATCAPSVSITAVAAGLRDPGRALGLHFVDAGDLVEVVVAEQTTAAARDRAASFASGLDREAIAVRDVPGFAVDRLSLALSVEAMRMLEDRVAGVRAIDRAMEAGRGLPVGPLAAADAAGLDARLEELERLASSLSDRFSPPPILREKVAAGDLGQKTGEGFYVWEGGERAEPSAPNPVPEPREDGPSGPDRP